jgi:hypothetical protein
MPRSLMGLDNVEWAANILDEANIPTIIKIKIKTKSELKADLRALIIRYNKKEIDASVVFDLITYIDLHYPSKKIVPINTNG